jgi:hypothetical protein
VLVALIPSQKPALDAQLATSLSNIAGYDEGSDSVNRGLAWGEKVGNDTLAWAATDGRSCNPAAPGTTCPNRFGSTTPGVWRPVPPQPAGAGAALPQYAGTTMRPYGLDSRTQFLFPGHPALTSAEYAADVNEVAVMGRQTGSGRTAFQSDVAFFYADNSPLHWNRIANTVAVAHKSSLLENARTFAYLNVAMVDAVITVWNAKYSYALWRPYHAVRLADQDGNDATTADTTFVNFIPTPGHMEYGSGHGTVGGAAAEVLAAVYGDAQTFTHISDTAANPFYTPKTFTATSFTQVQNETNDARVFGGIHFRTTQVHSDQVGRALAGFILANRMN